MAKNSKKTKPANKRTLVALAVIVFVCVGLAFHTGTGTLSIAGISSVAALCPLGAVEAAIASRTIVPAGVIGLVIVVVLVLLVGRAFCGWACPMGLLRRLFGVKSPHEKRVAAARKACRAKAGEGGGAGEVSDAPDASTVSDAALASQFVLSERAVSSVPADSSKPAKHDYDAPDLNRGGVGDSRMWVLGGALLSTAAFGFPVFCLVCPVGLTFAIIICLWRAFQFGEATLSLLVFPAILIIEVVVLRRWCHTLCPLGALMGLIARGNKTFRAKLDANACLESKGATCGKCAEACPEGIDLHEGALSTRQSECLKCGECKFACPAQAITFPFLPKKFDGEQSAAAVAVGTDRTSENETTSKGEAHEQ